MGRHPVAAHFPESLNIVPVEGLDRVSSTTYDYVIVGGGAGGCPLAAALAEDKSLKILLLERGASREKYPETWTQLGWFDLPNSEALQLSREANGVWFARGNVLGGGTSGNHGVWGHATGEEHPGGRVGSRCDSEHGRVPGRPLDPPGHQWPGENGCPQGLGGGRTGPERGITPKHVRRIKTVMRTWTWDQKRRATDELLVGLDNVDIVTRALVSKVRITHTDGDLKAVGVDFTAADNAARRADVTFGPGEVILCAGTVGPPQLLVLSGIGPAGALEKLGLCPAGALVKLGLYPLVNLPVGLNLANNPLNTIAVQLKEKNEGSVNSPLRLRISIFSSVAGAKRGDACGAVGNGLDAAPRPARARSEGRDDGGKPGAAGREPAGGAEPHVRACIEAVPGQVPGGGDRHLHRPRRCANSRLRVLFAHPDNFSDAVEGVRVLKAVSPP
ncbi:hypothetical protein KFL_002970030 [Klebsormidium nitens]|uniref:Glucose-methanol-choline oxidoreductase N-terminal domain-containing protein n=1 Tax=Klebsormidium nitens TaxID=105231 RepID=A0A1Y1I6I4_KLENI|nr:hypothetical protein KFL_002970030 [Klebsormidium nitens]|eukprot:GAQ86565.1 hypothetical protein KFL_002970030 [Klebsormidium nitens]